MGKIFEGFQGITTRKHFLLAVSPQKTTPYTLYGPSSMMTSEEVWSVALRKRKKVKLTGKFTVTIYVNYAPSSPIGRIPKYGAKFCVDRCRGLNFKKGRKSHGLIGRQRRH